MGCAASKLDNEDTVRRCKERRRLMKEAVHARHQLAVAHADYCRSLRITGSALSTFAAGFSNNFFPTAYQANSTYSNTPSQASSVWNWENFYPPSPPDSEFFDQKLQQRKQQLPQRPHHLDSNNPDDTEDTETERSEYDFFRPQKTNYRYNINSNNAKSNFDEETEREEVQCSEWGDHDHDRYTTTSSSDEEEEEDDMASRSEIGTRSNFGSSKGGQSEKFHHLHNQTPPPVKTQPQQQMYGGAATGTKMDNKSEDAGSSAGSYRTDAMLDMKMVVRHRDLKEIVDAIKEHFDKAAAAGDQVSEMLEIGRAQLDKSFRQLKKTVYHSSSMLSNLSSSWTSKPPLAVKYRLDATALNESGGSKSLCSTLDRLLAWEKKLYEEVKAREGVKIEHEKKLSALQSQEYKGEDETKIDKTKASITRLQSLIIVTSQAVSTTSTAIIGLRDSDLVPQLVEICHGCKPQSELLYFFWWLRFPLYQAWCQFIEIEHNRTKWSAKPFEVEQYFDISDVFECSFRYMWASMHQYHEVQNNIVQQVRGLINRSGKGDSTSELHRQATRDLESAVSAWHSNFCRLIKFQRDFICSLHGWFKLTLLPVSNDDVDGNREPSEVYAFCDEWKLALDRVPDTVASEAIKSFINVVHVISVKQAEELKIKKRTEGASKELEKKASSLRTIERKFYHSYSMVGIGVPDSGPDHGQGLDARDPLAEKKSELAACQRRVEDEMLKHAKAVEVTRAMTLNNLQTGLPGVFQALTSFSALFTEALETVCARSYHIK
ncbi:hypothetical protein COLO4_12411 [Corchorus olitorius]|uniref:DUF632 domain-containing protein n=1 Tax=Corchorus olitorius TaxID=93759 RepID=A0A1R3K0W7_9ROSI|nr:hypothetical protein COLO4_12411 [Corchorus olitorius]